MKQYNRVCARINLDAIAYNMEQMKKRIGQDGRLIAVIKTDAYGHGAVPLAEMFEETPYIWGYAVACMGEARTLRAHGIKKPILILGCVFPDEYEEMVEKEIRAAVYTEEMAQGTYANLAIISHSSSEFLLDFIRVVPGAPKAQVKSRVILTPDNAKRLLFALQDNLAKFEEQANGKTAKFEDFVPPIGGVKGEA